MCSRYVFVTENCSFLEWRPVGFYYRLKVSRELRAEGLARVARGARGTLPRCLVPTRAKTR
jgi:hypothetical protein